MPLTIIILLLDAMQAQARTLDKHVMAKLAPQISAAVRAIEDDGPPGAADAGGGRTPFEGTAEFLTWQVIKRAINGN